jgi:dihydroxyacetone kinase phosphotransfer subunit
VIGIVIVSHSARLAEGVKELAGQMAGEGVTILAAGGALDGSLGTNAEAIGAAIDQACGPDGVLVLMDLGSAVMSAQVAVEMLAPERAEKVVLSNAPLVEGAVIAAVEASIGKTLQEVDAAALRAAQMQKVER